MIDTLKIVSGWEKEKLGLLFCKEGGFSSIVCAFSLQGMSYLYKSREESEQMYKTIYDLFDSLPTSSGQRRWYFQLYGIPSFNFDDIFEKMKGMIFVDGEYKDVYERLVTERIEQLKRYKDKQEVMRYRLFFIVRCYSGSSFVDSLREALQNEEQLFSNEMDTFEEILEDFERIEAQFSQFSPKRLDLLGLSNLIRNHYGLHNLTALRDDSPLVSQIFTKEIEFHPDHTRIVIDNDSQDIYLRTYSVDSFHSFTAFLGLSLFDFSGDFSITQSFTIPDNRRMIFMLKAKVIVKEIISSIPVLNRWVDRIKEQQYIHFIAQAIADLHKTGQKRVKIAIHLTLRSNELKDKRTRTKIRGYFNELQCEELYERCRHDMINIASAAPASLSKSSEHALQRFMTVKMSDFSRMPLLFTEDEGAETGFIDYTTQGIFKIDPLDPRLKAKHQMTIGQTGSGKTFRKNRELTLLNMMNVNSVSISSKDEDCRRTRIMGGIHYDLSLNGSTRLSPFSIPERARKKDQQGRQLYYTSMSHMLDFLQTMTNNFQTDVSYRYQSLLQDIFQTRNTASVSRIMEELKKREMMAEAESIGRFSAKGLWGGLFDDEEEFELDIYKNSIISVNTKAIKHASTEVFDLAIKILMKKTIDIAAQKKGTTIIALDEVKDMLKDPRRAMLVATMFSEYRSFDALCSIYDQDAAFLEDGKIAKIIRTNAPRVSILGIDEKDDSTAKILGLNSIEEELCHRLQQKPGYWSEIYTVYNLNEHPFRQKVYSYTTPTEYAINTTEPKDCYVYDAIYESFYNDVREERTAHIMSIAEFSQTFPHGVIQHPDWKIKRVKVKENPIDFYRELKKSCAPSLTN